MNIRQRSDPHGGLLLWMLHFLDSKHIVQNSLKGWFEQWQNWQYQGFYFFAFFSLFSFFSRFFHFFSLNFRFASIFSLNFRLFYLRFRFRFLVFRIEVNHVKSGFFFASKRNEIFVQFQISLPKRKWGRTLVGRLFLLNWSHLPVFTVALDWEYVVGMWA